MNMPDDLKNDIVRGVAAIALILNTTSRGAYHLLEAGRVPGAFKLGGRTSPWMLSRSKFREGIEQKMPAPKKETATGSAEAAPQPPGAA